MAISGSGVACLGLLFVSEVASPRGKETMLSSFLLLPWRTKGLPREKKMNGQYFVVCVCSSLTPNQTKTLCDFFQHFCISGLYFLAVLSWNPGPITYGLRGVYTTLVQGSGRKAKAIFSFATQDLCFL